MLNEGILMYPVMMGKIDIEEDLTFSPLGYTSCLMVLDTLTAARKMCQRFTFLDHFLDFENDVCFDNTLKMVCDGRTNDEIIEHFKNIVNEDGFEYEYWDLDLETYELTKKKDFSNGSLLPPRLRPNFYEFTTYPCRYYKNFMTRNPLEVE